MLERRSMRSPRPSLSALAALAALATLGALAACGPRTAPDDPGDDPGARAPDAAGATVAAAPDAGAGAAASPPDARPPLEEDMPELARRGADLLVALGDALAGDGDCAALAAAATAVFTAHREVRVAAALAAQRGRGPDLDAALEAHATRIAEAAARMQPALTRCAGDAGFVAALTPFDVP